MYFFCRKCIATIGLMFRVVKKKEGKKEGKKKRYIKSTLSIKMNSSRTFILFLYAIIVNYTAQTVLTAQLKLYFYYI